MRATKAELLCPMPRPPREVEVPGLDLAVAVRALTAAESSACLAGLVTANGLENLAELQACQLAVCLVDPVLTLSEARQITEAWTASAVSTVLAAAGEDEADE